MKKLFLLLVITCLNFGIVSANNPEPVRNDLTEEEVFSNIQRLLDRAVGEKKSGFMGERKITKQVFARTTIACYQKALGKHGSEWVNRYSDFSWNDFFDHSILVLAENSKLSQLTLIFKKNFKDEYFTSDRTGDDSPNYYNKMELFILEKDKTDAEKYVKMLYDLKEKKPESSMNATIRSWSKSQTIDWLKSKMTNLLSGGTFDENIKVITLDECRIAITWNDIVYKYEGEMPTRIKAINKYGKLEYDQAIAWSRPLNGFINDGSKNYGKYSSLYIRTDNEELLENMECALKHLSGFCGQQPVSTSSSASSTKPATISTGGFVLNETFSANDNQWLELDNKECRFEVTNGTYRIESKNGGRWFTIVPTSFDGNKDYEISATIRKISGTDESYFGLILGYNVSTQYYHFAAITGQGNAVLANKGASPKDLVGGNLSNATYRAVNKGNATNTIKIIKRSDVIRLYVNNNLIGETKYQPFYGNNFGFEVWSGNSNLTLDVDEISLRYLD